MPRNLAGSKDKIKMYCVNSVDMATQVMPPYRRRFTLPITIPSEYLKWNR